MVSMRMKRFGSKARPYYRIVVVDSRSSRQSEVLEELGSFRPIEGENQITLNKDQIVSWINKGASVSPSVRALLNKNGIKLDRKATQAK